MNFKRLAVALVLICAIGFSAVKVGALLPQAADPQASLSLMAADLAEGESFFVADPEIEPLNSRLRNNPNDYEARLLKGLLLFQKGALAAAIDEMTQLTARAPKFQLAHLVLGDLLMARYGRFEPLQAELVVGGADQLQIGQLQKEARARLKGYLSLVGNSAVPEMLLTLSSNTRYALVVDKSKNRLYVFHNPGTGLPPTLVDHFYIVLGKVPGDKTLEGDLKTPNGVYFVTSYLADEQLPPLYGAGAFPVNYPNELDQKLKKTGRGIWLHGTDKALYSRPPLDSEGCVVLTNDEFGEITQYVDVGRTPVIISDEVDWLSSQQWLSRNIEIQAALETWRQRWENADFNHYLQFYSENFWSDNYDFNSWGSYKKQVFASKTFQKIELSDLSILAYPRASSQAPVVVANFVQHYQSNNYNGTMRKRLYLIKNNEDWKILYEGPQ